MAAGVLAIFTVALIATLAHRTQHLAGTNLIRPFTYGVVVEPGKTVCQQEENVPGDAGDLRLLLGTNGRPGPAVDIEISGGGRPPARGTLAAGWREGETSIPITRTGGDRTPARVCVSNHGPAPLALAGELFGPKSAARIGSAPTPARFRIEYLRPGGDSWFGLAGELMSRIAVVRAAVPGHAALVLWALLGLVVVAGSVALAVRSEE